MPLYEVILSKPKPKYKNPFHPIHISEHDTYEAEGRKWEFEAKDEDEVRQLLEEAKNHPNVKGFELRSIKQLRA